MLDIRRIPGVQGFSVSFYEQWSGLVQRTAWTDFTFIHLHFEKHTCMGQFELDFSLLGFNWHIVYVYDQDTEDRKIIKKRVDEMFKLEEKAAKPKAKKSTKAKKVKK